MQPSGGMLNKKNKAKSEVFNLGTGNGYSVFEVIQSFEKVSGERLNYKVIGRRAGRYRKGLGGYPICEQGTGMACRKKPRRYDSVGLEMGKKLQGRAKHQ